MYIPESSDGQSHRQGVKSPSLVVEEVSKHEDSHGETSYDLGSDNLGSSDLGGPVEQVPMKHHFFDLYMKKNKADKLLLMPRESENKQEDIINLMSERKQEEAKEMLKASSAASSTADKEIAVEEAVPEEDGITNVGMNTTLITIRSAERQVHHTA